MSLISAGVGQGLTSDWRNCQGVDTGRIDRM
jgi:hypothetical protein